MSITLRPPAEDELDALLHAFRAAFGGVPTARDLARGRARIATGTALIGVDAAGSIAATAASFPFGLATPGGSTAPCAGISLVSVRGDHRRRGVLRAMMDRVLTEAADRGQVYAALWASETPIYGRFGFGPAIPTVEVTLDRRHAALHLAGPVGEVVLVDAATARTAFPPIRAEVAGTRSGLLSRPDAFWEELLAPVEEPDGGGGPRLLALLPGRGYAVHRLELAWTDGGPAGTVHVEELHATDPEAAAALWRFVTDVDLATTTVAHRRPPDDAVLALAVDQGRVATRVGWPLQVRILDLPAALRGRRYATDGEVVLAVTDPRLPGGGGSWRLVVRDGDAEVAPTDLPAELHLDVAALSTVVLGGVRTTQLVAAGRVQEHRPGTAAMLDRMLAVAHAPWQDFMF